MPSIGGGSVSGRRRDQAVHASDDRKRRFRVTGCDVTVLEERLDDAGAQSGLERDVPVVVVERNVLQRDVVLGREVVGFCQNV